MYRTLKSGAFVVFTNKLLVPDSSTTIAERDAAGACWQMHPLTDSLTQRVLNNFPTREALLAAVAP